MIPSLFKFLRASSPTLGISLVISGQTGEYFDSPVSVGIMYFVKLSHMVDDKLHARSFQLLSLMLLSLHDVDHRTLV